MRFLRNMADDLSRNAHVQAKCREVIIGLGAESEDPISKFIGGSIR